MKRLIVGLAVGGLVGVHSPALGSIGDLLLTFQHPEPVSYAGFGRSVATVGDNVLIGAPKMETGTANPGSAYLFDAAGNLLQSFSNPVPGTPMPSVPLWRLSVRTY